MLFSGGPAAKQKYRNGLDTETCSSVTECWCAAGCTVHSSNGPPDRFVAGGIEAVQVSANCFGGRSQRVEAEYREP
jgi:hypothetical protein